MMQQARLKYGIQDMAVSYLRENRGVTDEKTFKNLLYAFSKFLMKTILDGERVKLPARMGEVFIKGKKMNFGVDNNGEPLGTLPPDWKSTRQLWENCPECKEKKQLVFHLNEDTNGVIYSLFWSKKNILTANKSLYSLVFTRANKRNTNNTIESGKEYIVVDNRNFTNNIKNT